MPSYHNNLNFYFNDLFGYPGDIRFILAHKRGQLLVESRCRQIITRSAIGFRNNLFVYIPNKGDIKSLLVRELDSIRLFLKKERDTVVTPNWEKALEEYERKLDIPLTTFDDASIEDGIEVFMSPFWLQSPPLYSAFLEIVRCFIQKPNSLPVYAAQLDNSSWGDTEKNWLTVEKEPYYWAYLDTTYFKNINAFNSLLSQKYKTTTSAWPKFQT